MRNKTPENQDLQREFAAISAWGMLTSLDIHGCAPELIRNADEIKRFVAELCDLIQMKRFGDTVVVDFGEDPRVALRANDELSADELEALVARLARLDRAAASPWTQDVLQLIAEHPGVVSTELAPQVGMDRPQFKLNVRKLKSSGLTESLEVGYRISPRGRVVLDALARTAR